MTRWARAGSTQKHKKQPGDATPWSEFANKGTNKSSQFKQKKKLKQWKKLKKTDVLQNLDKSVEENVSTKVQQDFNEELQPSPKKLKTSAPFLMKDKKKKRKKKYTEQNIEKNCNASISETDECNNSVNIKIDNDSIVQDVKSKMEQVTPSKNKNKKKFLKKHKKTNNSENSDNVNVKIENPSLSKEERNNPAKKKEKFLEKIKRKRADKGMVLLPAKVERRLYNIKRRLREKGLSTEALKDIIRRERRKEELKFRKTFNTSKLCFNCRKPGHILADCPEKFGSSNQETGICFKCGSTDHTSFKCPNKVQGFPYAKCFICKEQGHISKDCPKNKRGIYPKGGRCNLCGNVNHLKKDCPSLIKKKNEESSFTLSTISEATSIDDEVIDEQYKKTKKPIVKKPKIVKF